MGLNVFAKIIDPAQFTQADKGENLSLFLDFSECRETVHRHDLEKSGFMEP